MVIPLNSQLWSISSHTPISSALLIAAVGPLPLAPMFAAVFLVTGASLVFALWMARWVIRQPSGPEAMRTVADAIREGAEGFL